MTKMQKKLRTCMIVSMKYAMVLEVVCVLPARFDVISS